MSLRPALVPAYPAKKRRKKINFVNDLQLWTCKPIAFLWFTLGLRADQPGKDKELDIPIIQLHKHLRPLFEGLSLEMTNR